MREQKIEIDQTLHGEFNALRAQVAINDGDPEEAERLAMVALKFLPLANYYSRIVATSVTRRSAALQGRADAFAVADAANRTDGASS